MIRSITRNRRTPLAAVCLFVAVLAMAGQASADEFYVAFWNVENLFDTVDDPKVEKDEEFTPTATKQWTEERFEDKLQKLARVISDMNGGHGPDVLGVAEVENRLVLEKLVEHLKPLGRDYDIVHHDSPSEPRHRLRPALRPQEVRAQVVRLPLRPRDNARNRRGRSDRRREQAVRLRKPLAFPRR